LTERQVESHKPLQPIMRMRPDWLSDEAKEVIIWSDQVLTA
jgi:hypothetical protein